MPSFDISIKFDKTEIKNAVQQIEKEISNRFDFKNTAANVSFEDSKIVCVGENDFQIEQIKEIVYQKFGKRKVDVRLLRINEKEHIGGNKIKQVFTLLEGVDPENSKKIVKFIKEQKTKVQASIQGVSIKVSGNKKDMLQSLITILRKNFEQLPLSFDNFRD